MNDPANPVAARQWARLRELVARLEAGGGFYAEKLAAARAAAGGSLDSLEAFCRHMPVTTKAELAADREAHPPFGSNLPAPLPAYTRYCQTSGTSTGKPMPWLDTAESWEAMLSCWRRVLEAAGLRAGCDRIFFAFSFGPFLGFWTAFEAAARDYLCIPGGGMSSRARLECMAATGATALCCTPTYALRLGAMIGAESGVSLADLPVKKLVVAGEPGGSVPAVRAQLSSLWGGAAVFDHHGMTETGPVTYEEEGYPGGLFVMEDSYLAEVVDRETGAPVADGGCGELLLTTLARADSPVLRYRTGDLVRARKIDGRLWLEGGILGRADDMVVVRGVNVLPSAVDAVVREFSAVDEYQVALGEEEGMGELVVTIECPSLSMEEASAVASRLESRLRDRLNLRMPVRATAPGTLPEQQFKARRWLVPQPG
jgi:phenylacetate-CoA ligase